MSKISDVFKKGKAFIPFVTCGDPSLMITRELIYAMSEAGADIIELGIPFSDPTAEGPVIQEANKRALATGVTTDKVFEMLETVSVDTPLAFMTYANVLFSYGIERFVIRAKEVGIQGIILPDIPYEEKEEFEVECQKHGVDFISLIAPNSKERTQMIAKQAEGFVYCVSSLGVTGVRTTIQTNLDEMIQTIKQYTDTPCAIGFGISAPDQAKAMSQISDGVIVGSAIVKLCQEHKENCVPYIKDYVLSMKNAIK